jgi:hypothetical protein
MFEWTMTIRTRDMTPMQEEDSLVFRIFIITKGQEKGQAEVRNPRQSQSGTEQQAGSGQVERT